MGGLSPMSWKGGQSYGPPGYGGPAKGVAAWGGGGGGCAWGGGEAWGGEAVAVPGDTATGTVIWVNVGDNALTQQGFPADGPAMVYEKGPNIFSSSAYVLGDIVGDISNEVQILHDPDWQQYPDIGAAIQAACGEEHCFAVAVCAGQAKWGLGLAPGWKGRESAAKLALAVALSADNPQVAGKLARSYPEFGSICRKQGVAVASAVGNGGGLGNFGGAWPGGCAGGGCAAGAGVEAAPVAPAVHWLTLSPESNLMQQGFPADAPAISHSKEKKEFFSSAHHILQELVPDLSEVAFEDDAEWKVMPEVGAALTASGAEDNCYVVATCPSQGCWGVGLASGWKGRESAGKMALALALAQASGRIEELGNQYPEFGEICVGAGLMQPTKKRRKGGW